MKTKAIVDISFRIVVTDIGGIDAAIDNFINRALQADIPVELYTEGLVSANMVGTHIFHKWEEG